MGVSLANCRMLVPVLADASAGLQWQGPPFAPHQTACWVVPGMDCACAHSWGIGIRPSTKLLTLLVRVASPTPGLAKLGAGYSQPSHPTDSNRPSGWLGSDFVQVPLVGARAHAAGTAQSALGSGLGEAAGGSGMLLHAHLGACALPPLRACAGTCQIAS
eukprot:3304889-Amphidinium_carterae.1